MLDVIFNYLWIVVVLVLTGMGLPLPEEVPIIAAGVASSLGTLNPWGAFACCLVGALIGDCMLYSIGYHFGHNLIRRHPRFAHLVHAEREAMIEQMIKRHGLKVFFLARFMVGIRAPMYLAAGTLRMRFRRFLVVDAFATCVVGFFFGLSYYYGEHLAKLISGYEVWFTIAVLVLVAAVILFVWRRNRRRAAEGIDTNGDAAEGHDHSQVDTKTWA